MTAHRHFSEQHTRAGIWLEEALDCSLLAAAAEERRQRTPHAQDPVQWDLFYIAGLAASEKADNAWYFYISAVAEAIELDEARA